MYYIKENKNKIISNKKLMIFKYFITESKFQNFLHLFKFYKLKDLLKRND